MEREALLTDLMQAQHAVDDVSRHIFKMRMAMERGDPMPRTERMHAAEKLSRASEIIRRSYDD